MQSAPRFSGWTFFFSQECASDTPLARTFSPKNRVLNGRILQSEVVCPDTDLATTHGSACAWCDD